MKNWSFSVKLTAAFGACIAIMLMLSGVSLLKLGVMNDAVATFADNRLPKAVALGEGTAYEGLQRYAHDAKDVLTTYWSAWPAVHFVSFTVCPTELRIVFVASVSFVWLVYLSYASHKEMGGHGRESE